MGGRRERPLFDSSGQIVPCAEWCLLQPDPVGGSWLEMFAANNANLTVEEVGADGGGHWVTEVSLK